MTLVSVDDSLIKEALVQIELSEQALLKVAEQQRELDIIYQVISLAQEGLIDIDDMQEKIAEFTSAPDSLLIFKKAVALRSGGNSLGRVVSNDKSTLEKTASVTPETTLFMKLRNLTN